MDRRLHMCKINQTFLSKSLDVNFSLGIFNFSIIFRNYPTYFLTSGWSSLLN